MNHVGKQCQFVSEHLSLFVDGCLGEGEFRQIASHLAVCLDCASETERVRRMRMTLRALPQRTPPPQLAVSLKVIASRERTRMEIRRNWRSRWKYAKESLCLWRDNMMRPLAVPAAGGLVSTFMMFMLFSPFYRAQANSKPDVPINLGSTTQAKYVGTLMPMSLAPGELTVELIVDEQGRMVDYKLPDGPPLHEAARHALENDLLFTQFVPATAFGQPVIGKVRVTFRHTDIDVKG